jgi:hypothetical protein
VAAAGSHIEKYNAMNARYLRVLALYIEQIPSELGEPSQRITLQMLKKNLSGKISITFLGVQNLRVADVHPGCLCDLDIISVLADQLEGLSYQVFNTEQDLTLSFYCRDFEVSELPL